MTRPSPRKVGKARVWKGWAVANTSIAGHLFNTGGPLAVYRIRGSVPGFMLRGHGLSAVRVTIREVLPRKAGARRAR